MPDWVGTLISIAIVAVPVGFLAMAIRHFIGLIRGFHAPLWIQALGPFALMFDKYLSESARSHRKPFVAWFSAFLALSFLLISLSS